MRNYANFNGRAGRPEYWWFTLANLIISVCFLVLSFLLLWMTGDTRYTLIFVPMIIYSIAIILPSFAVTVRRLHDIDKSAWWLLLGLIPYIGGIILLILTALKTHPHPNKYGTPDGWEDMLSQQ